MPIAPFRMGYLLVGRVRCGVGIGVGVLICSSESESDSESLKLRRLRCNAFYYKIFFYFFDQGGGHGQLASPAPWLRPCRLSGCAAHTTYHGGPAVLPIGRHRTQLIARHHSVPWWASNSPFMNVDWWLSLSVTTISPQVGPQVAYFTSPYHARQATAGQL